MPTCEILDLLDSHGFYTIGDFGTVKKSKGFCFGYDFEVEEKAGSSCVGFKCWAKLGLSRGVRRAPWVILQAKRVATHAVGWRMSDVDPAPKRIGEMNSGTHETAYTVGAVDPARIFKRLWGPWIDSKEWIPPAYVAWRAGTITLFLLGSLPP